MTDGFKLVALFVRAGATTPDDPTTADIDVLPDDTRERIYERIVPPPGYVLGELYMVNAAGGFYGALWLSGSGNGWQPDSEAKFQELVNQAAANQQAQ